MSTAAIIAYSAALLAPAGAQIAGALTGVQPPWPYTFNLCVSNVPGPREPLYFNGSRLEATYPVSIPIHGMALNITLQSYADTLNFGFVGCRDRLPHLQRLAVYTGDALRRTREGLNRLMESCDVCIVGAGIAGLNALFVASRYLTRDQKIVLIDRREHA